jgi:hypothetical protein
MKNSRVFTFTRDGVERLPMWAHAVRATVRSNNEPTRNHPNCGRFLAPLFASGAAGRPLWLITKHENDRTEVFTIYPDSVRETLPIFSYEEEAEMFLWFGAPEASWRTRETTAGELVSLLCGPCADVGKVALDPLPLFGDAAMAGLVSLLREDFVRNLMKERPQPRVHGRRTRGPAG